MPSKAGALNQLLISFGSSTATRMVLPDARDDALFEKEKCRRFASCSMRSLVSGLTLSSPRSARDTVETDTPAAWATSAMVVRGMVGWLLRVDYAGGRLPATASLYHDTLLL